MAAPMRPMVRCVRSQFPNYLSKFNSYHGLSMIYIHRKYAGVHFTQQTKVSITGTVNRTMCYDARKVDVAPSSFKVPIMFDTHAVVKKLEESGFTQAQAESVVRCLMEISQTEMEHMNRHLVTKSQQEIMLQQVMSHISSVKKDMIILEKSEFSALKHEYEKQHIVVNQMKEHFDDETSKLRSGVTLDLNLEKSRAKDAHAENQKRLDDLRNAIEIERSHLQRDVSGLDNKIEKEIAHLLATYERYRNDVLKYSAGAVMTCLTVCLGFFRLWS